MAKVSRARILPSVVFPFRTHKRVLQKRSNSTRTPSAAPQWSHHGELCQSDQKRYVSQIPPSIQRARAQIFRFTQDLCQDIAASQLSPERSTILRCIRWRCQATECALIPWKGAEVWNVDPSNETLSVLTRHEPALQHDPERVCVGRATFRWLKAEVISAELRASTMEGTNVDDARVFSARLLVREKPRNVVEEGELSWQNPLPIRKC